MSIASLLSAAMQLAHEHRHILHITRKSSSSPPKLSWTCSPCVNASFLHRKTRSNQLETLRYILLCFLPFLWYWSFNSLRETWRRPKQVFGRTVCYDPVKLTNHSAGTKWAVFKWSLKVITTTRLRLLFLVIGLQISRHFFSQWEAQWKPIAPCTRDFPALWASYG